MDGSWGYDAETCLRAVLGGDGVDRINKREGAMSPDEMRSYLMDAPKEKNVTYGDEARRFAKAVLVRADEDADTYMADSKGVAEMVDNEGDYDLTGFMFGWAMNAVRYILGGKPNPNPAIVTIDR